MQYIQGHKGTETPFGQQYYKVFIVLNKAQLENFHQKIANLDKKDIIIYVQKEFSLARERLAKKLSLPA